MRQILCRVVENRGLWPGIYLLTFDAADLAQIIRPGQFALARDPRTFDPYLRRRVWFYAVRRDYVSFLLPTGSAQAFLARAQVNSFVDLLAPVGRALELPPAAQRILLLGENDRAVALLAIAASAVQKGCEVVLSVQAQSTDRLPPAFLLPPEVEYHSGTEIEHGQYEWADQIIACGSDEFYRGVLDRLQMSHNKMERGRVRILQDPVMPCGTGACYACAVVAERHVQRACVDGPWFDLLDLRGGGRNDSSSC